MTDTRKQQEALIIDHNRHPRNFRKLPDADRCKLAFNPLCGDRYEIYLNLDAEGRVREAAFTGEGCAISKAAASLMTEALPGKTMEEVEALFAAYHAMVTSEPDSPVDETALGDLALLSGVRQYPVRIKCATLPWRGALAALHDDPAEVS
jgi:nitrogen fixation NifU-like protein